MNHYQSTPLPLRDVTHPRIILISSQGINWIKTKPTTSTEKGGREEQTQNINTLEKAQQTSQPDFHSILFKCFFLLFRSSVFIWKTFRSLEYFQLWIKSFPSQRFFIDLLFANKPAPLPHWRLALYLPFSSIFPSNPSQHTLEAHTWEMESEMSKKEIFFLFVFDSLVPI